MLRGMREMRSASPELARLMRTAASGAGLLTAGQMAVLQRTIGNQAVQRVMANGGAQQGLQRATNLPRGASSVIQRWPTNTPTLDWGQTKSISPIMSGQPVLFFRDATDPPVVVKSEDAPYGLTLLNAFMHKQVHGTPTVVTRDGTADRQTLIDLIENPRVTPDDKWTQLGNAKDGNSWIVPRTEMDQTTGKWKDTKGATPADKARFFMGDQFRNKPKVQVMKVAVGDSTRKLAQEDKNAPQGQGSRIREAFSDAEYVRKIGQLTAADLFVENADRALMNFGNFMTDANNALLLIDNMDSTSQDLWKSSELIGPVSQLDELAPSRLESTAKSIIGNLTREVKAGEKGGEVQIKAWLAEATTGGTREQVIKQQLVEGLGQGRARLIKLYATRKSGKEGRQAKKGAKQAYKMDVKAGDVAGGVSYWERLKARARYLKSLT